MDRIKARGIKINPLPPILFNPGEPFFPIFAFMGLPADKIFFIDPLGPIIPPDIKFSYDFNNGDETVTITGEWSYYAKPLL